MKLRVAAILETCRSRGGPYDASRMGRPQNLSKYVDTEEDLLDRGVRDGLDGGVPASAVAAELGIRPNSAREQLLAGVDDGQLERVHGIDPETYLPRTSFIPATTSEANSND